MNRFLRAVWQWMMTRDALMCLVGWNAALGVAALWNGDPLGLVSFGAAAVTYEIGKKW
jgi:hypothetical protein